LEIFIKEFIENYNSNTLDISGENPLKIQFKDYSEWFNKVAEDNALKNELFWKNYLQNYRPKDTFDSDFDGKYDQQKAGKYWFEIVPNITSDLKKIAQEQQVTFYTLLVAAINLLIYKFSDQNDICIGTVNSGRNTAELNNQIGMFVKTLVLRTQIKPEQTFADILKSTQSNLLEINDHQDVPFNKFSQSIFDVMFVYQNPEFSFENIEELKGLKLNSYPVNNTHSRMPLVFNLVEKDNKLKGVIDYNADLFEENTIQIIALRYSEILNEIVKNPLLRLDLINSELEVESNTALDFDFNF
jgi:non-ribosomal peptide synthetase component F